MPSKDIALCISAPRCGLDCQRNPAKYTPGTFSYADFGAGKNFKFGCEYRLSCESAGYTPKKEKGNE